MDGTVTDPVTASPPLPASALLVAWTAVLGELAQLGDQGLLILGVSTPISSLLTAAVVAWVTHGVLAGRPVRGFVALALVGLSTVLYAVGVLVDGSLAGWEVVHLTLSVAMLAALVALVRSPYHRWQRRHHDTRGVGVAPVVLLAAVAGLLGPLSVPPGPTDDQPDLRFELRL